MDRADNLPDNASPLEVLSEVDSGDDSQRRFRYQAAVAAMLSLSLLDDTSGIIEIFCEQHEDVLVRSSDGTFMGVQVKTRDPSFGPFTFGDQAMKDALARFVETEIKFPGKFSRYSIKANCGFWEKRKDVNNLKHCLDLVSKCTDMNTLDQKLSEKISDIALAAKASKESTFEVLKKVVLSKSPDLERYEGYLVEPNPVLDLQQ